MTGRAPILGRITKIVAGVALVALIAGCGQSHPRRAAPVVLSQLTPASGASFTTRDVTVAGTVSPHDARVLVAGRHVPTSADGHFSTTVALASGTNLIDVLAGAPRARPAMSAVRVVRYLLVTVPSVEGASPRAAAAAIRRAGLKPKINGDGDPLAFLVPLSAEVCSQSPAGNARVAPGSTVTLSLGKVCL